MSKNYGVKIKYMAKVIRKQVIILYLGEIKQLHDEQAASKRSHESV